MERVHSLSSFFFPKQEVITVDEVVSAAVAPPHYLLLAQKNRTILVKNNCNNTSFIVPTVDQAVSVHHSVKGNYIASLESRGEMRFVRAYIGWEVAAGSGPLRAPLSQQSQPIEILEVPTPGMPDCIGVCSNSGNMVVSCGSRISLFSYNIQTHKTSRVDLLKAKWTLELAFTPTKIRVCENFIAAFNDRYLHVVRVGKPPLTQEPALHCESTNYDDLNAAGVITTSSVVSEPQVGLIPFYACPDLAGNLSYDSPEAKVELEMHLEDIVMLQLDPRYVGSSSRWEITDLFTCLVLQPYYDDAVVPESEPPTYDRKVFRRLTAVACFYGTKQNGYLFHFIPSQQVEMKLIAVYTFSTPLITAVLDDCVLHALTDAGLETYTLRVPTGTRSLNRLEEHGICFLGRRPFFHVRELLLGDHNIFLIASEVSEPSTVFKLTLADSETLWTDFLSAAKKIQWEAPPTYSRLVRQAHYILKARRERFNVAPEKFETLFREACAVLADHYILYGEVEAASALYRASWLEVTYLIKRIPQLFENVPEPHKSKFSPEELNLNMLLFLEHCLKIEDDLYRNYRGNKEDFYTPKIGRLLVSVLNTADSVAPSRLSQLILSSPLAQSFDLSHSTLSAINERTPADTFALALVSIQRGQQERGLALLQELEEASMEELIRTHSEIILKAEAFSEFGLILLKEFFQLLATVLSQLIKTSDMNLAVIQKNLIGHLLAGNRSAYGKNAAAVLQTILENVLARLLDEKKCIGPEVQEHARILTWLYLTQLSQRWEAHCEGDPLFKDSRPSYLDHIPPIGLDLNQILSPQASHAARDSGEPKHVLLKLQCLLASGATSLYPVRVYLARVPNVFGCLSIQVLCASPQEALQLFINHVPQAFIAYLKETQIHKCDWRNVVNHLADKISAAADPKRKFYYQQIEQGVLEHIAQNLTLKDIKDILPADNPSRNNCLRVARNNERAARIKARIMKMGAQLS